jgi:hypothetical protein
MNKLVLQWDDENAEFWAIGIISIYQDYRLAFQLNKHFGIKLIRAEKDLTVASKNQHAFYCLYSFADSTTQSNWYFVQNRAYGLLSLQDGETIKTPDQPTFFFPGLSKFDYLMVFNPPPTQKLQTQILKMLREVPGISFSSPCELKIKELNKLNLEPFYDSKQSQDRSNTGARIII